MSQQGTVTRWNEERGFGFIKPSTGGSDVFCHRSALGVNLLDIRLIVNATVYFDIQLDRRRKGKHRACNISGPGLARGGGDAGDGQPGGGSVSSDGMRTGVVKKWVAGRSHGFIRPDDGGVDVFVHSSCVPGGKLAEGTQIRFANDTQKPKATQVILDDGSGGGGAPAPGTAPAAADQSGMGMGAPEEAPAPAPNGGVLSTATSGGLANAFAGMSISSPAAVATAPPQQQWAGVPGQLAQPQMLLPAVLAFPPADAPRQPAGRGIGHGPAAPPSPAQPAAEADARHGAQQHPPQGPGTPGGRSPARAPAAQAPAGSSSPRSPPALLSTPAPSLPRSSRQTGSGQTPSPPGAGDAAGAAGEEQHGVVGAGDVVGAPSGPQGQAVDPAEAERKEQDEEARRLEERDAATAGVIDRYTEDRRRTLAEACGRLDQIQDAQRTRIALAQGDARDDFWGARAALMAQLRSRQAPGGAGAGKGGGRGGPGPAAGQPRAPGLI